MFKFKILPIVVGLPLLVSSCARKPGKYDLTGVWESECTQIETGRQFTENLVYHSNKIFEGRLNVKYKNKDSIVYSGTYKADKDKLEETINQFNVKDPLNQIIKTQTKTLDWINDNSVIMTLDTVKCTAIRLTNN